MVSCMNNLNNQFARAFKNTHIFKIRPIAAAIGCALLSSGIASAQTEFIATSLNLSGAPGTLELSDLNGSNGFTIQGARADDFLGVSVSKAGDINNDGIADIIIGARGADSDTNNDNEIGKSYILFGKNNFASTIALSSLSVDKGFIVIGSATGDYLGAQVSNAGDFNGDGVDDMIIASYRSDPGSTNNAGTSYLIFGNSNNFQLNFEVSSLNGSDGFAINGVDDFDFSGRSVSYAGDINNDGIDDIIIAAIGDDRTNNMDRGKSYVIFGTSTEINNIDLSLLNGLDGFTINHPPNGDYPGNSVSGGGDFNADGIDDIIIGSHKDNGVGASYIIFGNTNNFSPVIELSNLDSQLGSKITGSEVDSWFGVSVSFAGDINNDTIDDLIIGATNLDAPGKSYVVFGSSNFPALLNASELNGTNGFVINGTDDGDRSGRSLSNAGDFNGDGIDDLIIGAPYTSSNARSGISYLVFGSSSFVSSFDLSSLNGNNGFKIRGRDPSGFSGFSVDTAGDVNDDGFDDIIIGATFADANSVTRSGESYIVFGRTDVIHADGFE